MIARLNGEEIDSGFERYHSLVKSGVAGFILFGGELEQVRRGIEKLQGEAELTLVIASDLERGLGQQLRGGTLFPPAMALGRAWDKDREMVVRCFETVAQEAAYAGINTVFAPVLDIDINPANPIISTRAFGRDPETVSTLSVAMIRVLMSKGIVACGKHFPGHGDTSMDSHMGLPIVNKTLDELISGELVPFIRAIKAGLPMIMTGHLRVPALDPSGTPVTLSRPALQYLREPMGFHGLITTDAMDMGAIREYGGAEAALMALDAGVDMLLHPGDPEALINDLEGKCGHECRLDDFRKGLARKPLPKMPEPDNSLPQKLSALSLSMKGRLGVIATPGVVAIIDDENSPASLELASLLDTKAIIVRSEEDLSLVSEKRFMLTVSSGVRAYKGGSASWIRKALERLAPDAEAIISFSRPDLIDSLETDKPKIQAYWDSAASGRAVYEVLINAGKNNA